MKITVLILGLIVLQSQFLFGQKFLLPSVVSPNVQPEEWPVQKQRIYDKILQTWGICLVDFKSTKNEFREVRRYNSDSVTFIVYKYHVVDDCWDREILVLPENFNKNQKYPVVMPVHGTYENGADGVIDPKGKPNRAYGNELANS